MLNSSDQDFIQYITILSILTNLDKTESKWEEKVAFHSMDWDPKVAANTL